MTPLTHGAFRRRSSLNVVLFSGGRGSDALARQLLRNAAVDLTVAINGYDDGASTGEVRRFFGDCLGPSDFRKNASRLATELGTAPAELVALLDYRLPKPCDAALAPEILAASHQGAKAPATAAARSVWQLTHPADERPWGAEVAARLAAFLDEHDSAGRSFDFSDCSVGNLVFAGSYLRVRRDFNAAVDDYCALLALPADLIQNVTDGTNAYLVALDTAGMLLASEEAVVDAKRQNRIDEIFLIDRPLTERGEREVAALAPADRRTWLQDRSAVVRVNPSVVERLTAADLIIYAPGTQHSSLFPSYLTPGLSAAIAGNLSAIKLLITNLHRDAEITGASAVDIIDRALYYMREKGRLATPTPCLITHYLMNDPGSESPAAYVPLGAVDALEDPRLVRIANYEEGVTGRHDAERILAPFIASLLRSDREPAVAVYLHDADSPNKVVQTLLEMMRGGVSELPLSLAVIHSRESIEGGFVSSLPFSVRSVPEAQVIDVLRSGGFEYVILFESSGMYRGEDIVSLASQLAFLRLDAIWGSRRLSMKDVDEAFRLRYQHNWPLKMASRFGSHFLSVLYLGLFGQYISDTLSGARAVRSRYLFDLNVHPSHKLANHQLLTALLRDRSEVLEVPVRFFPISPGRVKRTSIVDGLDALLEIVVGRFRRRVKRVSPTQRSSSEKPVTAWKA